MSRWREPPGAADPDFWDRGYCIVPDFISADMLAFLKSAMETSQQHGGLVRKTDAVPQGSFDQYSSLATELLLKQSLSLIEAVTGRKLLPAYSYWRMYEHGAELIRHTDREACEISVTLPIHADPAEPQWPIWMRDLHGAEAAIALSPGSAAVYRGALVKHWREPLAGRVQYQVFLHYVVAGGAFEAFAYDAAPAHAINRSRD